MEKVPENTTAGKIGKVGRKAVAGIGWAGLGYRAASLGFAPHGSDRENFWNPIRP